MREFYFVVNPVESRPEKDMRVYSVVKPRKEEGSYKEAARAADDYVKAMKRKTSAETSDYAMEIQTEQCIRKKEFSTLQSELVKGHSNSLEERQEQMAFRKRAQESSARRSQMVAAYGKE